MRRSRSAALPRAAGAIMGSNRLGKTIELNEHSALIDACFIRPRGAAASEEAPASGEDSRNRKLGIFLPRPRIGDRTIADDPICLGHGFPSLSTRCQHPFDARPTLPPKCQ